MIELQKELTVKEIKYKIKELEDDLNLYLTLKKINYEKTQPQSVKYQDIVIGGGNKIFDKFTHYVIKDEDYDATIYAITEAILAWEQRLVEKIKNISESEDKILITYLRDDEEYSWERIARETNYSERQARRIYNE
jgi:aspartokinase